MAATAVSLANQAPNLTAEHARRLVSRRRAQQVPFRRTPARSLIAGIPTLIRPVEKLMVGVLGFGDEGRVQALELKENLNELPGVKVEVGLMGGYLLPFGAVSAEEDDTQGIVREIMSGNDVVCIFSPDMKLQASSYKNIFSFMKSNTILAISDGSPPGQQQAFYVYNNKIITTLRANPEEIGTFIGDLNIEVRKISDAGTNSSLSMHQEQGLPTFPNRTTTWTLGLLITVVIGGGALLLLYWEMMDSRNPFVWARGLLSRVGSFFSTLFQEMMGSLNPFAWAGGLLSIVGSFFTLFQEMSPFAILLWVAALWLWYKGGNLIQCSGILLGVFSAVVLAISLAASLRQVQPTGAGSSTWPCDYGAPNGSCNPACINLFIIGDQNNVNIFRP